MMKLGILDQVPLSKGQSVSDRMDETIKMATIAEELGYTKYWFAEHHGTKGMLSSAPEIIMAAVAASTKQIRIGTGGILLPQYSPFKIAEVSKQLESLFPGRIDIGVGRSPGGTPALRKALVDGEPRSLEEFDRQLEDLIHYIRDTLPRNHAYSGVKASPQVETPPPMWLLGLGENSAIQAAKQGIGYVFGHFIKSARGRQAFEAYRSNFIPNEWSQAPQMLTAIFVVCAETDEQAEYLAKSQDLWLLRVEKELDSRVPSSEEATEYKYTDEDQTRMIHNRTRMIVGSQETVRRELVKLSERYGMDEFLILCNLHSAKDRIQSYRLLAEAMSQ
ncbi:LLM class flavin-dependent oxidoreductase [Alkalicoccobacillus murimartini]|uniref:Luciferase family oxidoreductase group 1 n=1 Tax=Alkalicoccobacillus murimartini TaxID=171685 RepID=A0ABT9YG42_9BACI|nr:LLM class flavin-dependent oxidoreductase [Alkalicoccobacillus murimartini]MDQ0206679.1 luciferase family oxidoreductase group 1 [Alkalicoccobacillus murimartini]